MKKLNILFTCAGKRNYLINAFKATLKDSGAVYACDSSYSAPALYEADAGFIVPKIHEKNYLETLLKICRDYDIKVLISLHDIDLPIIAKNKDLFLEMGTYPLISSYQVINICFDKWETTIFCNSFNIKTPITYLNIDDAINAIKGRSLRYPLILKPRWGSASIGIESVEDEEELKMTYKLLKKRLKSTILCVNITFDCERTILIQQKLSGQEFGLDVINDLEGNYHTTFVKKKISMRAGETDRAVTVEEPLLSELGEVIGRNLKHIGILDCDAFLTDDGPYLLEMNPRFGGGYPFSHFAGADVPSAIIGWLRKAYINPEWLKVKVGVSSSKCDRIVGITNYSRIEDKR